MDAARDLGEKKERLPMSRTAKDAKTGLFLLARPSIVRAEWSAPEREQAAGTMPPTRR